MKMICSNKVSWLRLVERNGCVDGLGEWTSRPVRADGHATVQPAARRGSNAGELARKLIRHVVLFSSLVTFQNSSFGADDPTSLLNSAYKLTKTAKTVEQYGEIVDLCNDARRLQLTGELSDYAKKLLAWAHNRRGETYSEQASELAGRGEMERAQKLDAAALADFEQAVANESDRWKALHNRGVSYALIGKYEQALKDFDRVTKLKPDYANAWFNRAEIRFELREFAVALQDYEETLRLLPDDLGALTSRGRVLLRLGRAAEAVKDLDRAVQLSTPQSATVLTYRGEAHQHLGQWEKAATDFRKAIDVDPQLGWAFCAAAWLMATCPDEKFRDAERAMEAAKKAIELDGESDFRHSDVLAAAYANANRFPEAKKEIDKGLKTAPPDELSDMKKRQTLYSQNKPYRMEVATRTTKPENRK